MPKLYDEWTVLPHGPLCAVGEGLLTVVGLIPMPLGNFPRRMTVVALPDRRSALFSPIALHSTEMKQVESLGSPEFLIIPNQAHRLDARPFRARYPAAKIVTPPAAKTKVGEAVPVDDVAADMGDQVSLELVAGTDDAEFAMLVRHADGTSLITNDIIGNVGHPQGPGAWIMSRLMGFGPEPRVPRVARKFFVKDQAALATQLRKWAQMPNLRRIIPSHGDVIDDQPADVLNRLADSLN